MKTRMSGATALRLAFAAVAAIALPALAKPQLLVPYDKPSAQQNAPNVRSQGYRVQFNRAEMAALKNGNEVELALPNATRHSIVVDLVENLSDGIINWIGHYQGKGDDYRVVITSGPAGTFGRISTPERQYRLVPGSGHDWLVDMAAEAPYLPPVDLREDTLNIPRTSAKSYRPSVVAIPEYRMAVPGVNSVAKTHTAQATVDLMVVHTPEFRTYYGSTATMNTRLAFLVAMANAAYADSGVGIHLRLVHTVEVAYPQTSSLNALYAITPYTFSGRPPGGTGVFSGVEALRAQYGADMVAFMQAGSGFGGDGIAWKPSFPVEVAFDEDFMYSVTTGCMEACENVFIHELGHNMGNAHDRATAAWQDGGTTNYDQGSYPYSFGYYSCNLGISAAALSCNPFVPPGTLASGGNPAGCAVNQQPECKAPYTTNQFKDLMAYFHQTAWLNNKFSNPAVSCVAQDGVSRPCGISELTAGTSANTVLSMNNNRDALSAMRAAAGAPSTTTLVPSVSPSVVGQAVTYTATVAGEGSTPTGTVTFRANGSNIAGCVSKALAGGVATCVYGGLPAGAHQVAAQYSGDVSFLGSTSNTVFQTVYAMGNALVIDERGRIDFNNDGMGDLSWKHTNGTQGVWLMNGLVNMGATAIVGGTGALIRLFGDFDGDGKTDVLWRRPDGSYHAAMMNGLTMGALAQVLGPGSGWEAVGKGDFNADGKADLVWKHAATGTYGVWLMNGAAISSAATVEAAYSGWQLMKIGDFNADGKADTIWQHSDGRLRVQVMDGTTVSSTTQILGSGTGWSVMRLADFNGDLKSDVLLRHTNGSWAMWLMDGATVTSAAVIMPAGLGWNVVDTGDFDGDGKSDLFWAHTNGTHAAWLMNGTSNEGNTAVLLGAGTAWTVSGNDDYNGDGKADLIWRNTNGSYGIWLMDGLTITQPAALFGGGTGWNISP